VENGLKGLFLWLNKGQGYGKPGIQEVASRGRGERRGDQELVNLSVVIAF
jgi:hypothetical protein